MKLFADSIPSNEQVTDCVDKAEGLDLKPLRISVLRNVTVEAIESYLQYEAVRIGCRAQVDFGGYDTVVQEANGAAPGLLDDSTDVVLVFLHLSTLSPALADQFATLSPEQIAAEIEFCAGIIRQTIAGIRRQTQATVLWASFEPMAWPALGIQDAQLDNGQAATVQRLNAALREALAAVPSAYVVDLGAVALRLGINRFYDTRYWQMAKAPYSDEALSLTAAEMFKFVRAKLGKTRKCLVLDCDNTLWGGVVGEDGLEGIKLGTTYPGSAYLAFQRQILELHARGVIIALVSKNNEADVWEVFDRHPDMLLKREHIASAYINWQDKAANLRSVAKDLNIATESLVFVDDSAFELGLVEAELPEVATIRVDPRRPSDARWLLSSCGHFDLPNLTAEDRKRGSLYQAERSRRDAAAAASDLAGYCRSLKIGLTLDFANDLSIPRLAQQTQKTNQFNLTTRRYSDADMAALARDPTVEVIGCKAEDKYGDMGIIGTAIVRYRGETAYLDTFLMSCRALGRGIERRFLFEVLTSAARRGAQSMSADFIPTAKNQQVERFLPDHGFIHLETLEGGGERYRRDLANLVPDPEDWFEFVKVPWVD